MFVSRRRPFSSLGALPLNIAQLAVLGCAWLVRASASVTANREREHQREVEHRRGRDYRDGEGDRMSSDSQWNSILGFQVSHQSAAVDIFSASCMKTPSWVVARAPKYRHCSPSAEAFRHHVQPFPVYSQQSTDVH